MHRIAKQSLDRFLLQAVDGSLAGVIFLVPLLMGGRHAVGQLVLTVLAVAAAWAWAARQCLRDDAAWRSTWAAPLILAGLAIVALQAVPLPLPLLAWLTPHSADILPLWNATESHSAAIGVWPYISFAPAETLAGLVLFLDFALLFFVAVQRVERVEDVERLLRWCALSAVCMAVFGIVQLLTSNGSFFWFYRHPFAVTSDSAKGGFSNRNHFAHFLALGIGPLIWWLQDASRHARARAGRAAQSLAANLDRAESKTYLLSLTLGIVLFAGLLSLSRGGISVMFLAAAVSTAICYRASAVSGRFLAALAAVGLLIGVSLTIFGFDRVSSRLDDLSSGSLERLDGQAGRRIIWAAAAKAIPDHLLLGAGVGSFHDVYPMYADSIRDEYLEYTHAENGYLQVALETGAPGFVLLLAGIMLIAFWCVRGSRSAVSTRLRVCAAALAGSLAAGAVHGLVDFVWYVPACMAIVAILAACALRVQQLGGKETETRGEDATSLVEQRAGGEGGRKQSHGPLAQFYSQGTRPRGKSLAPRPFALFPSSWVAATAALTLLGGWMIQRSVGPALAQPHWDEYLVARQAVQTQSPTALADAEIQRQWIACLEDVIRWQPTHARAHLALAESHRRLFDAFQCNAENQMSLANIRDAAIRSQFPTREALTNWLSRAVGPHWLHLEQALHHTRQAIRLNPLQGRGYVYLADLSFLDGADATAKRACVEQAMRVRPFDGAVLYAAGSEALLAGNAARWLEYSKQAFRCSRQQQQQFIGDFVASAPTEDLPVVIDFIVREFQPDLQGLRFLHATCAKRCPPEQLFPLMQRQAEQAQIEAATLGNRESASIWLEAQQLYGRLGRDVEALQCARNAAQCDPGNYNAHFQLASCLLSQQSFADAESHLRWCLQRTPNDPTVEIRLREALKGRLDGQHRAAVETERLR